MLHTRSPSYPQPVPRASFVSSSASLHTRAPMLWHACTAPARLVFRQPCVRWHGAVGEEHCMAPKLSDSPQTLDEPYKSCHPSTLQFDAERAGTPGDSR